MITLEAGRLHFRFPDVHERAHCSVSFQRTLRIPDDGAAYPLPPGFGNFPLRHLDDHSPRLPREWRSRGGVLMPMHQAEAMWIHFGPRSNVPAYPFAVKIAAGKVCAVSREGWTNHLNRDPQDYVVPPRQPWLDGFCVEKGMIRQFVAMPLGEGYTVEEQLTGAAEHGGVQIVAYPMKAERYEAILAAHVARQGVRESVDMLHQGLVVASPAGMGLAPGGRMRQEIYDDPYGLDAWDQRHRSRCFVTIANSAQWMALTGEPPPNGTADGEAVRRCRAAVVRLLRWRRQGRGRRREVHGPRERGRDRRDEGRDAAARKRIAHRNARRQTRADRRAAGARARLVLRRIHRLGRRGVVLRRASSRSSSWPARDLRARKKCPVRETPRPLPCPPPSDTTPPATSFRRQPSGPTRSNSPTSTGTAASTCCSPTAATTPSPATPSPTAPS